jgi:hypothetical protein
MAISYPCLLMNPMTREWSLSQVQVRIKVPFDRLKNYISELKDLNLIEDETSLRFTEEGKGNSTSKSIRMFLSQ